LREYICTTVLQAAEASIAKAQAKFEEAASVLQKGIKLQQECNVAVTLDSQGLPCTAAGDPCEPLVPLWRAQQDAKSALAAAESTFSSCQLQLEELTATMNKKWCKTQLYWTKGLAGTADELRKVLQAGIPVVAAVHLHSAAQSSGENVTGVGVGDAPLIYQAVKSEQVSVAWDDLILQIAAIDVATGKGGGQFVNLKMYEGTQNGATGVAVEGAHEMTEALKRLSECLPAYRSWKAEHTLLRLPEVRVELGHYTNLLDTVPQEQQSIAVILHCLVEQVACSSTCIQDAYSDSIEARQGLSLMNAALENLADPEILPESIPTAAQHVTTIMEGDLPEMANHGLLTGLVRVAGHNGIVLINCRTVPMPTHQFAVTIFVSVTVKQSILYCSVDCSGSGE
jgi:hypothetical protein